MAQFARPNSDVDNSGGWSPSTGTALFACVSESVPSSAQYFTNNAVGACDIGLSGITETTTNTAHYVRYQYWRDPTNRTATVDVSLYDNTTLIAGPWTHTNPGITPVTASQALTTGEADSISTAGYEGNLKIRFNITAVQNTQSGIYIGWVEFEAPDPPVPPLVVSASSADMVGATVNPTVLKGSITYTPTVAPADTATIDPTVLKGTIQYTPVPAAADTAVTSGSVLGILRVTPAASVMDGATLDPTVVKGSISYSPTPAAADGDTIDPTTVKGSITYTPTEVAMVGDTVNPTTVKGTITYTPTPVAVDGDTVNPSVVYSSLTASPTPAAAAGATVDPTVFFGSVSVTPTPVASDVVTDYGAFIGGVGQTIIGMSNTITGIVSITL